MAAFKKSANPELAAAFLEFANQAEQQEAFASASNFLPTRNDLIEKGVTYPDRQEDMDVFIADLRRTPAATFATVAHPAFSGSAKSLVDEMSKVVAGQGDAKTAVQTVSKTIEKLVAETAS